MYQSSSAWLQAFDSFNFDIIILFSAAFNAVVCDSCVLLNFSLCTRLYRFLCCGCSVCCTHCFMYCSIRRIMINVEDKLTDEVRKECASINKEIEMEISMRNHRQSMGVTVINETQNDGSQNLPMPLANKESSPYLPGITSNNEDLHTTMKKVRNLDLNAHKIESNSIQSASATPTVNKMAQFVVDPTYYDDVLEEKEEETEIEKKKRISKKIMNITITSPDNQDIIVMKNDKLKKESSGSPKSPRSLGKKYGLDLNFHRTTTLKKYVQQEKEKVRSDEEVDSDYAYDTDDDDGNASPHSPGPKLGSPGSRPNSTKYADGSVAAILASIEQDEADLSENEDEVGDMTAKFGKNNSLKSRSKRMSQSLSTAL